MGQMRSAPGARGPIRGAQLITTDPPLHDDLRRAVREYFAPRRIRTLDGLIADHTTACLARAQSQPTFDVAQDFAWPLTLGLISDMLGIPDGDRSMVLSAYHELEYSEGAERLTEKLSGYSEYFDELAARRQAEPRDDLISKLMAAVARGELTRADALMLCKDLFEGGVDVPANLIANSLLTLAALPGQRAQMTAGESARVRLGVEELARYDPPIQYVPRIAASAVTLHGVEVPQGATVLLALGAANRDERRFADPDTLDLERPAVRNNAFGAGIHFCIGAPLARLVASLALPPLLGALGEYEVAKLPARPRGSAVMRGFLSLEVATNGYRPPVVTA
jgi:cytochrome P450